MKIHEIICRPIEKHFCEEIKSKWHFENLWVIYWSRFSGLQIQVFWAKIIKNFQIFRISGFSKFSKFPNFQEIQTLGLMCFFGGEDRYISREGSEPICYILYWNFLCTPSEISKKRSIDWKSSKSKIQKIRIDNQYIRLKALKIS